MISVHTRTGRGFVFPLTRSECRELALRLMDALELEAGELELCLVDDVEMSMLHEQHLGGIGPTNVLAFPNESEEFDPTGAFAGEMLDPDAAEYDESDVMEDDDADDEAANDAQEYAEEDDSDGPQVFLPEMFEGDFSEEYAACECGAGIIAGSIVFSVDALHRECVLYDQEPGVYFARLLAHALLHLSGVPHGEFMEERMDFAITQALAD